MGGESLNILHKADVSLEIDASPSQIKDVVRFFVPSFVGKTLEVKALSGGITNVLYRVSTTDVTAPNGRAAVCIRIHGLGTEAFVDRGLELQFMVSFVGVYGTFKNGVVFEYINGHTLQPDEIRHSAIIDAVAEEVARMQSVILAKGLRPTHTRTFSPFLHTVFDNWFTDASALAPPPGSSDSIHEYLARSQYADELCAALHAARQSLPTLAAACMALGELPDNRKSLTHNDLLPPNILVPALDGPILPTSPLLPSLARAPAAACSPMSPKRRFFAPPVEGGYLPLPATSGRVRFIDYEYGGTVYALYDIANHFQEWGGPEVNLANYPTPAQQAQFITVYLRAFDSLHTGDAARALRDVAFDGAGEDCDASPPSTMFSLDERVADVMGAVRVLTVVSNFLWGVWGVIQASQSSIDFDYVLYALRHLQAGLADFAAVEAAAAVGPPTGNAEDDIERARRAAGAALRASKSCCSHSMGLRT